MSQTPSTGAGNGARPTAVQAALVIDTNIERHLLLRRAIRQTDLFTVILSAESVETAQDILNDTQTPRLQLILVEDSMAGTVLASMSAQHAGRTALVSDTDQRDTRHPVISGQPTAQDIIALLESLS